MTDHTLLDALFLTAHPTWSQRDLDEADQDIVDLLSAIQHESAQHSRQQDQQARMEAAAASHRARIGLH